MKFNQIKIGTKVIDRWWPNWGTGVVKDIVNTTIIIQFPNKDLAYDKAHVQFLEGV